MKAMTSSNRGLPAADEVDLGVVKNAQHQMLSGAVPRVRFSQMRKSVRTTKIALTIDAAMPASSVTAKPLHRSGAELVKDGGRQRRGDVRVDDGAPGVAEALVDRGADGLAAIEFLADALEDQEVRVDRHTDGEHEAGDARQREHGAEPGQHRQREERVEHQAEHREHAAEPVVDDHDQHDDRQA